MPEVRDWYDTPLYYDIVFDGDTAREAEFLEAVVHCHGPAPGRARVRRALEPACGSGRLVVELARRGWRVSGFDASGPMLDFARDRLREQGLKARLWRDRLEGFTLPRAAGAGFHLAHCLVSTFKYLLTGGDAVSHLRLVARALAPGGIYALGFHLTDYERSENESERWVGERDGARVVCQTNTWPADRRRRLEALRTRLSITKNGARHVQETHWQFRTYNAAQVRALLRLAPDLELVGCYDFTYDISSPRKLDDSYADIILILRRR